MTVSKSFISLVLVVFLTVTVVAPSPARTETSNETILGYNLLITGTLTVIRGTLEGTIHSVPGALRSFGWGALAGGGFYQAKKMVADGEYHSGLILSNLSYSLAENAARDRNPIAKVGYSVGPIRLHYNSSFSQSRAPPFTLDYSLAQTLALGVALSSNDGTNITFENGLFVLRSEDVIDSGEDGITLGSNVGYFTILSKGYHQDPAVYKHEFIHGIQSMQFASTSWEPYYRSSVSPDHGWYYPGQSLNWFDGWRLETTNLGVDLSEPDAYHRRPVEIEAWNLVQGSDPPKL
jgi:hypothetical protein